MSAGGLLVQQPMTAAWRSQDEWSEFFCLHSIQAGPICRAPEFDFEDHMLIGVFWGLGFSGCTDETQSIKLIRRSLATIEVQIDPIDDLGPCEALVSPRQIVRLESATQPVVFTGFVPE